MLHYVLSRYFRDDGILQCAGLGQVNHRELRSWHLGTCYSLQHYVLQPATRLEINGVCGLRAPCCHSRPQPGRTPGARRGFHGVGLGLDNQSTNLAPQHTFAQPHVSRGNPTLNGSFTCPVHMPSPPHMAAWSAWLELVLIT